MELVGGFSLHDEFLIDNHVESVLGEVVTLIKHLHGDLASNTVLTLDELALQSHHVDMLEESIAQVIVDLEECPDHRMREVFFNQVATRHAPKLARYTPQQIINLPPLDSKTPRQSIRVIRTIRLIRMKLPSRWPDETGVQLALLATNA